MVMMTLTVKSNNRKGMTGQVDKKGKWGKLPEKEHK